MDLKKKAKDLVAQMTLEEKASLCSGKNFWYLKGIERLGLPEIMVTDGPHGLRKQELKADHLGLNNSVPAVCFPTASVTACSFDRELLKEMGKAIGEECRQEKVSVILGPGVNIKRSPLCGRNFEYFSEDPFLSGEMAAAFINGVQSQNVGVSIKHFAANNQEKRRLTIESVLDERTFREIYLPAFEMAVKKSQPWTVMCSYNRIFGEFASQYERLLTTILRDEWGFEGLVVSDWGANVERVKGVRAGMDLEMPHVGPQNDARIVQAVKDGTLSLEKLDGAATRVTELILRASGNPETKYDVAAHHATARRIAAQSAVLLKNEGGILPGNPNQKAAVIGAFARHPRYQGTGSSKIQTTSLDDACEELQKLGLAFEYAEGYLLDTDEPDEVLINEACKVAAGKDIVYLFAGLPDRYEAEGFDRKNMSMPKNHNQLIEAISKVNPQVVVVLQGGAPMETPWADQVKGILMMYLAGQAGCGACADLLLGVANPGGKLAETWPMVGSDAPTHENFPGSSSTVEYREGLFVGYRFYDKAQKRVRYPFGHGLSYTQFDYADIKCSAKTMKDTDSVEVSCTIKNTGKLAGSETVQLYVACKNSVIIRPEQELKGFEKVTLKAGESKVVSFTLSKRNFSYYNVENNAWHVESGDYEIRVAASSQDIRLITKVHIESTTTITLPDYRNNLPGYYDLSNGMQISDKEFETLLGRPIPPGERPEGLPHTINSTMTDIQDKWLGRLLLTIMKKGIEKMAKGSPDIKIIAEAMMMDMPLRFLTMSSDGGFTIDQVDGLVEMLNGHFFKGLKIFLSKKS